MIFVSAQVREAADADRECNAVKAAFEFMFAFGLDLGKVRRLSLGE